MLYLKDCINQIFHVSFRVSVLVAVYNVEQYLPQCLDSLSSQTLRGVEFIVVNDGSTDNSARICDEYAQKDSRFRVIHKERNEGLLRARQTALSVAKGRWIVFVDGDDWLAVDSLRILYESAERESVDILQFSVEVFGGSNEFRNRFLSYLEKDNNDIVEGGFEITKQCFCDRLFGWNLWNKIYRACVLKKATSYVKDEYFTLTEDIYQFFLYAFFASTFKSIKTQPLYNYRVGSGISTTMISIEKFDHIAREIFVVRWIREFLTTRNMLSGFSPQILALEQMIYSFIRAGFNQLSDEEKQIGMSFLIKYHVDVDRLNILKEKQIA